MVKLMDEYVTGTTIKMLRQRRKLTQAQLADILCVSDKTISKWETGRGFPDISFLEPLAKVLQVSVLELLSGKEIVNNNKHSNIKKSNFYTCPICGNIIFSVGKALISCCGVQLPELEIENSIEIRTENSRESDIEKNHKINVESVEDELFVSLNHPMSKEHYISWIGVVRFNSVEIIKLYPEGNPECRIKYGRQLKIFAFCNKHGLFEVKV